MAKKDIMETMKRNLLRGFIPQIKENLTNINPFLKEKLLLVPLEGGETHAGYVLVIGSDDVAHMLTVAFDEDDKVVRIVEDITVIDFIENLLKLI